MISGLATRIVPSQSDPKRRYRVDALGTKAVCNCPGYRRHGYCKHTKEATSMAEQEEQRALATVDAAPAPPGTSIIEVAPPLPPGERRTVPSMEELGVMMSIAASMQKAELLEGGKIVRGMVPANIKSPEAALGVMIAGWELGIKPFTALRHIYVVNGKTEPDMQLALGLLRAQDPTADLAIHDTTPEACDMELWRRGRKVVRIKCSMAEVKAAGVNQGRDGLKPVWAKFPADMLRYYTLRRVLRLGASDVMNRIAVDVLDRAGLEAIGVPETELPQIEEIPQSELYNPGDDADQAPEPTPATEVAEDDAKLFWREVHKLFAEAGVPEEKREATFRQALMLKPEKGAFRKQWLEVAESSGIDRLRAFDMAYTCVDAVLTVMREEKKSLLAACAQVDPLGKLRAAAPDGGGDHEQGEVGAPSGEGGPEQGEEEDEAPPDPPADESEHPADAEPLD